jgi:hypothetical protein
MSLLGRITWVSLFGVGVGWLPHGADGAQAPAGFDDAQVLAAVIEQSIRPQVEIEQRIAGQPPGPLMVIEQTLRTCDAHIDPPQPCRSIEELRTPDRLGSTLGSWDYRDETRHALVESFNARNSTSTLLPLAGIPNLVTVRDRDGWQSLPPGERPNYFVEIGLPGYSSNAFAVVYGQYITGPATGQGWVFILSRTSGRWEVQHAYGLWSR